MQSPNYNNNQMYNMIEKNRVKSIEKFQNDLTKIYMVNPNGGQQQHLPGTESPGVQYQRRQVSNSPSQGDFNSVALQ
jgi:hypothetical protein